MQHPFLSLKEEYKNLVATVSITPSRVHDVMRAARFLIDERITTYMVESDQTKVPTVLLASLDYRESGANLARALGQGDPWNRISTHVPKGYGPFASKIEADVFYIRWHDLDEPPEPWSWEAVCFAAEGWNGFGPRNHGIRTSYLWGATNHQQRGKYVADGQWNSTVWDKQIGIIPLIIKMIELDPQLSFTKSMNAQLPVTIPVLSTPMGVGGAGVHDVTWLQSSLNEVFLGKNDQLRVDGDYGRFTRRAVKDYQRTRGIISDGIYGPQTDRILERDVTEHA